MPECNGEILDGYCKITDAEQYTSVSVPKVVFTLSGKLLYMSRSAIPGNKSGSFVKVWRQVCVYAFPHDSLVKFSQAEGKTPLEAEEDIEILRFLELGDDVKIIELSDDSVAVDNPEDVEKVIAKLKA